MKICCRHDLRMSALKGYAGKLHKRDIIPFHKKNTHNGKYASYVEVCGPQGPIFEYKGSAFS